MSKSLNIIEQQLELGDVKTISSGEGNIIKFIELLFSSTTKAQFALAEDKKTIMFSISDNNLDIPQLACNIDKCTLRNFILSLKNIYNCLEDERKE